MSGSMNSKMGENRNASKNQQKETDAIMMITNELASRNRQSRRALETARIAPHWPGRPANQVNVSGNHAQVKAPGEMGGRLEGGKPRWAWLWRMAGLDWAGRGRTAGQS